MAQPQSPREPRRPGGRSSIVVALASVMALAAAGCTAAGDADGTQRSGTVSVKSCGRTVSLDAPPQRVVIIGAALSDTLFALGLGDRISGVVAAGAAPLPKHRAALKKLPDLGDQNPSREALIASKPDLVISEQAHQLSGSRGTPSIKDLEASGIAAYVSAGGCAKSTDSDTSSIVSTVLTDIENYGTLFGVRDRARELAARCTRQLDEVKEKLADRPPVRVAQISQIGGQIYAAAGAEGKDLALSGADNVFADLPGTAVPVSTEQVTARNPQAFILFDSSASRRQGIDYLERTFPTTDAVKNKRLFDIEPTLVGSAGSTRQVTAIVEIAEFLHPNAFPWQP